jgi:hypothetical protein
MTMRGLGASAWFAIGLTLLVVGGAVYVTEEGGHQFYGISRLTASALAVGAFAVATLLLVAVLRVHHSQVSRRMSEPKQRTGVAVS